MSNRQLTVFALIAEQLSVKADSITPDSRLVEDLGADSLDLVELTMMLEETFGLELSDDQADQLVTAGDVVLFLAQSADVTP